MTAQEVIAFLQTVPADLPIALWVDGDTYELKSVEFDPRAGYAVFYADLD